MGTEPCCCCTVWQRRRALCVSPLGPELLRPKELKRYYRSIRDEEDEVCCGRRVCRSCLWPRTLAEPSFNHFTSCISKTMSFALELKKHGKLAIACSEQAELQCTIKMGCARRADRITSPHLLVQPAQHNMLSRAERLYDRQEHSW